MTAIAANTVSSMWRIENYFYYAVPYGPRDWEVRRFLDPNSPDEYDQARVDCASKDPDDAIHLAIARCDWAPRACRPRQAVSPILEVPAA